jgi:dihydrofolate reductase
MKINLIVAKCLNNGIGFQNKIPWHHKADLKLFKQLTTNNCKNAVIMGRKTYESLPNKPLANRHNIVISTTISNQCNKNISIFKNIQNGVHFAKLQNYEELWIIGGSSIYKYFLDTNLVDNLYITEINKEYKCDTFFPKLNKYYLVESICKIDDTTNLTIYKKTNNMFTHDICQLLNSCSKSGYWYEGD